MNPLPPMKTWLVAAVLVAIASSVQAAGGQATACRPSDANGYVPARMSGIGPSQPAADAPREDFSSLVDAAAGHALGEVWGRPVRDPRTRQLVAISAFLAQGDMEQMRSAVRQALALGVSEAQLREVVYLTLARTGTASSSDTAVAIGGILAEHRPLPAS